MDTFPPWPSFTEEEITDVTKVLRSNKVNYWTGTKCREFEKVFAEWLGCKHAIALANGTVALDLALKALGVCVGDEVIVTSRTFIASASCVVTCGALPIFADVDLNSQNISAETIKPKISERTKAIIVVHLAGYPADMDPIMDLAAENGLYVIEDCAQAHGAYYKGRSVGTIGHIGAWSFCQDKIMTTGGEGGMVTTNDDTLWSFMWSYKDHGKNYDSIYHTEHPPGFRWLHDSIGSNFRMTEMQAVIGLRQISFMQEWHNIRTYNASVYKDVLAKYDFIRVPEIEGDRVHAHYKFYCFVDLALLPNDWSRDRLIASFVEAGVPCFQGSCSEVYLETAFDKMRPADRLSNAKELGETSIMFLVHPTIERKIMDQIAERLKVTLDSIIHVN